MHKLLGNCSFQGLRMLLGFFSLLLNKGPHVILQFFIIFLKSLSQHILTDTLWLNIVNKSNVPWTCRTASYHNIGSESFGKIFRRGCHWLFLNRLVQFGRILRDLCFKYIIKSESNCLMCICLIVHLIGKVFKICLHFIVHV